MALSDWFDYRLEDFILFSAETLARTQDRYLETLWPLPVAAMGLTALTIWTLWLPVPDVLRKLVTLGFVAGFATIGSVYFAQYLSAIAPWGTFFAFLFCAEAVLLLLTLRSSSQALIPGNRSFLTRAAGAIIFGHGVAIVLSGLFVAGKTVQHLPVIGLAPDVTSLMFLFILVAGPVSKRLGPRFALSIIPALWLVVSGLTAIGLGSPMGYAWIIAGPVLAHMTTVRREG